MSRGNRIPGDDITDMVNRINDGDAIKEVDSPYSSDPVIAARQRVEEDIAIQQHVEEVASSFERPVHNQPQIPIEILDVLKSPERQELIEVAALLRRSHEHAKVMLFMTPIGDIRCTVNWMSCRPQDINPDGMFFVKTRANSLAFIPKPGAVFDIAFEGVDGQAKVVCLALPQRLYPSVDLLCFMPHTSFMEKTGQLREGAPSVVSGNTSTTVVDGEPVADGEQPMLKKAFTFDKVEPDYDKLRP